MPPFMIDLERLDDNDAEYHAELRHRCQTDGLFLAPLLGYHDFIPRIHQPVADLYIKKAPGISIAEQDPIKNRMHLDSRHTFKTSYKNVDTTQWMICFPDITIANVTATRQLSTKLTRRQATSFLRKKNKPLTVFQKLWPEYLVDNLKSTYIAPCRTEESVEPTLYSTSVGSSQSGEHPWILNPDDTVDTENSGIDASDASRDKVWNSYSTNLNTLRLGGYNNICGTRYHPFDLYGRLLATMDPTEWKMLIRGSLKVINGERLIEGEFPRENEVDLIFPELLSYKFLKGLFRSDYRSFMCQQQNDPQGGHTPTFDDKLYDACEIDVEKVPSWEGETFTCWRLPYGSKPATNKFVEGACGRVLDGRVYIIETWRFGGTPSHIAEMMVQCHKRSGASGLMVLETPGHEGYVVQLRNEAARKNISLRIQYSYWEENESYRSGQIKQMEPLMKVGRLLFQRGMTRGADCRKQFVHFGLIEETGLIECVQKMADHVPLSQLRANMEEDEIEWHRRSWERGMVTEFMEQQGMMQVEEQARRQVEAHVQAVEAATTTSWGMPPLPGGLDG